MTNFEKVKVFMKTFGQDIKQHASLSTEKINSLRISLIEEELDELKQAIKEKNIKEVADALTDILYVTYGAGHAFGIDLDKCFNEVQNSNMSKLGEDGNPIYNESGKVMKGPFDKNTPLGFSLIISFALVLHGTTVTLQLKSEKYLKIFFFIP